MSLEPRAEELLSKYPDQLAEDELNELRQLAQGDFLLTAMMESIHEAEALLGGGGGELEMSEGGREILDSVVTETLSENPDAGMTLEDLMAPVVQEVQALEEVEESTKPQDGQPPSEPREEAAPPEDRKPQRKSGTSTMWWALAALLVLGVAYGVWAGGTLLRSNSGAAGQGESQAQGVQATDQSTSNQIEEAESPSAEVVPTKEDPPSSGEAGVRSRFQLLVLGRLADDSVGSIRSGSKRSLKAPVTLEALSNDPRSLAVIEAQAEGRTRVLYPPSGARWDIGEGEHLIQPKKQESPNYTPQEPGLMSYILVARDPGQSFDIPEGGLVESLEAFLGNHDAEVVDRLEIQWTAEE